MTLNQIWYQPGKEKNYKKYKRHIFYGFQKTLDKNNNFWAWNMRKYRYYLLFLVMKRIWNRFRHKRKSGKCNKDSHIYLKLYFNLHKAFRHLIQMQ